MTPRTFKMAVHWHYRVEAAVITKQQWLAVFGVAIALFTSLYFCVHIPSIAAGP